MISFKFIGTLNIQNLIKIEKIFFKIVKRQNLEPPFRIKFDKENYIFTFAGDFDKRWDDPNYIRRNKNENKLHYISNILFFNNYFFNIQEKIKESATFSFY